MKKLAIGILAHVDSGKTTLSEAMLYCCGMIKKLGRVDHGDCVLDDFSLERERGITIFSKQALLTFGDCEFTLIDTPGHIDFSAEAERTLQVLDYAVLVISAPQGVQSHTDTLWKLLKKYDIPCFIFVNKMDMDVHSRESLMQRLRERLGSGCVDFGADEKETLENAALCDEKLLDKYYRDETLSKDDIAAAVKERKIFPCIFGSALRLSGVDELLSCLAQYTKEPRYTQDFGASVYKISEDANGERLSWLKITGGRLRVREVLKSDKNVKGEKVNQIRIYSAGKYTSVDEAEAGTVCAVTGAAFTNVGDGLGVQKDADAPILEPVLIYSVQPMAGADERTVFEKLKILEAEDPQLRVGRDERTGEIRIRIMGDIQLEILRRIIADRFKINVTFGQGKIIYKETIADAVEGIGHFEPIRHYAEVHLLLKPAKRGSGLCFTSQCREDMLDRNRQRLVLTHLREKTHIGVLTGSAITDMEISLVSGKDHVKHTEGGDFRQATYRAVRQGLRSAQSILLEPVYDFTLEVPDSNVGRALSDISRMSGRQSFSCAQDGNTVICGTAPVSEMVNYHREVLQYTHGAGKLSCVPGGYEPCHNTTQVVEKIGYDCDADTDNPCGSVFCAHGAGFNVKWDEVRQYMHLPPFLQEQRDESRNSGARLASLSRAEDMFALDRELMQIFEQTYGPVRKKDFNSRRQTIKAKPQAQTKIKSSSAPKYGGAEYLLVDGYNVIFSWENLKKLAADSLDSARSVLINILCNYRGYKKCEVILVFDAYKVKNGIRSIESTGGISVVYTKEAETADAYIEMTSHRLAKDNLVRVVTSDMAEQYIILGNGALRVSSQAFAQEVASAQAEIRELIESIK